jgi:hypothetical protein
MEWDYKIEAIHIHSTGFEVLARRLNDLGSEGWEVVCPIVKDGNTTAIVLRRRKPSDREP